MAQQADELAEMIARALVLADQRKSYVVAALLSEALSVMKRPG